MDELFIKGTPRTPEINFRPADGIFILSGRSIPEDADIYYYPLLRYLESFEEAIREMPIDKKILFEFRLVYYNSTTLRYLNSIMKHLETISEKCKLHITWYYDKDDEYIEELGNYMVEMNPSLDIEMIPNDPPPKKQKG